jgi:hypothetical protein
MDRNQQGHSARQQSAPRRQRRLGLLVTLFALLPLASPATAAAAAWGSRMLG